MGQPPPAVRGPQAQVRSGHQTATDRGLGHFFVLHVGDALHPAAVAAPHFHVDLDPQRVAGNHRAAEAGAFNSGEEHNLFLAVLELTEQQHSAGLRHGFYDQHAGHYRKIGKVSGKEMLVDGDILDSHNPLLAGQFHDPVNQQKWVTMRQDLENVMNVEGRARGWSAKCGLSIFRHNHFRPNRCHAQ